MYGFVYIYIIFRYVSVLPDIDSSMKASRKNEGVQLAD